MRRKVNFICLFALFSGSLFAQDMAKLRSYDFYEARQEYLDSLDVTSDSLKPAYKAALHLAENGISLTEYCYTPNVLAREKFAKADFFLYYPLPDKAWHQASDSSGFTTFVYRASADTACFVINKKDSLDIFSLTNGQERYFCSKNLYGMGGYDIYVQKRNPRTGKWSEAQNIGFPFNSPYDDFLFMNSEDGKYSIFASNRNCPSDSVWVYVIEFEAVPIRKPVSSARQLRKIAELTPGKTATEQSFSNKDLDSNTVLYRTFLEKVSTCREKVEKESRRLDTLRDNYADAIASERQTLASKLLEGERSLTAARMELAKVSEEMAALEMKFTKEGVKIQQDNVTDFSQKEKPAPQKGTDFKFKKHSMGANLRIEWK